MIGRDMGSVVLNNVQRTLWMLLSLILSATFASAQATPPREQITLRGTVQAVDTTARTVTILGDAGGGVVTLDVPQSVGRLNEIRAGDVVTAVYYDQVSVVLHAAGAPAIDRVDAPIATATAGALPGGTVAQQRVTTVTITAWDPATRVVTFTVPSGTAYSRRLVETTDANVMKGLKVGDRVDVTRTEAVRLEVQRTVAPETLRDRLTFSVLFGIDNQFSGKMIEQATGATTGGAPINLSETSYDDVYGRIGMLKIGAAYRTSPRTEGVFNFVWSSSEASESATQIGTVGNPPVALNVNFTEYQVLGPRGRPAMVLRPHAIHALRRLPRGRQPEPGPPRHIRWRAYQCHARARRAGRQVLRGFVGVQLRSDRWLPHRHWSYRIHGRDTVAVHGRAVGRGLAGRRRPEGYQQRELALVDPADGRRQGPFLITCPLNAFASRSTP